MPTLQEDDVLSRGATQVNSRLRGRIERTERVELGIKRLKQKLQYLFTKSGRKMPKS